MAPTNDSAVTPEDGVALLENLPIGFILLDPHGQVQWLNQAAQNLVRCRPGDIAWEADPDAFSPDDCRAGGSRPLITHEKYLSRCNRWQEIQISSLSSGLSVTLRDITTQKHAEKALLSRNARLWAIYEHGRDAVGVSAGGVHVFVNPAYLSLFGYAHAEDLHGVPVLNLIAPSAREAMKDRIRRRIDGHPLGPIFETRCLRSDGAEFDVEMHVSAYVEGSDLLTIVLIRDITARKQAEAALRQAEARYRSIFENAREGLFQTSSGGRLLAANPATAEIFGYQSPQEMLDAITDMASQMYVTPTRREDLTRLLADHGSVMDFESELRRKDGRPLWISSNVRAIYEEDGTLRHYEGSVIEITRRREEEAERTRHMTQTEGRLSEALQMADLCPLTGLLNHRAFHRCLEEETNSALAKSRRLAVAVLDMDNFKFFNDSYGHLAGDDVLRQVADALRTHCRASDTLARFGGDEFALLMPGLGAAEAAEVAARLAQSLDSDGYRPPDSDSAIPLRVSVGIAVFPEEASCGLSVLNLADERLLRSKQGAPANSITERMRPVLGSRWEAFSMLDALVTAVDAKDRCTRRHSEEVAAHCLRVAQRLGWDEETQQTLALAALLHDVGKIGIPDRILRKPGPLTAAEEQAMRRHPQMGAALVGASAGLEELPEILRHHHERWDGGGYPDGLRGEEIPLPARLLAVAEGYCAMISDRPFRTGLTPAQAQALLAEGAGTQWEPACVQAFLDSLAPGK